MAKDSKEAYFKVMMFIMAFLMIIQIVPVLVQYRVLPAFLMENDSFIKLVAFPFNIIWKCFYVLVVPVTMALFISPGISKRIRKEDQPRMKKYYWILSIPILFGAIELDEFRFYNILAYPLLFIVHMFYASRGFTKIGASMVSDLPLAQTSQKEITMMGVSYEVINDYGEEMPLNIHNPFQGMYSLGGAGSGKTASTMEPAIYCWIKDNAPLLIYDFKGNPMTLGLFAWNVWKETPDVVWKIPPKVLQHRLGDKPIPWKKPKFQILSFHDLKKTIRPNPIDPSYIKNAFYTESVMKSFLFALNPSWIKDPTEFFTKSAINLSIAIVERLRLEEKYHPYCTLSHVFEIACYRNTNAVISWLLEAKEVVPVITSIATAMDNSAGNQLAGQLASLSNAVGTLCMSPEIHWMFGAEPEYWDSLDVNSPVDPKTIVLCNDPQLAPALSPVISACTRVCLNFMNSQGKLPSAAPIDEAPTLYIDKLSEVPATSRSNGLCVFLGGQDYSQYKSMYKDHAPEIKSNMGNIFIGMTNNPETAKEYSNMFGTYKKVDPSNSLSSDSVSVSERMQNEKLFQDKDIATQPVGHFVGKVADGDPPMFSVQFKEFKKEEKFQKWEPVADIDFPCEEVANLFSGDQDLANEIFSEWVDMNFYRVKMDVQEILKTYA